MIYFTQRNGITCRPFKDVIIDNGQAQEDSNIHTNILIVTIETYTSVISNIMNVFIHRMTIITIIQLVPTQVVSFYGMNLKELTLDDHPDIFYYILLISLVL